MDVKEFSVSKETEKPRTEQSGVNGFLRPARGKSILFLILMGGINIIWISGARVIDAIIFMGLPLGFWPVGSLETLAGARPLSAGFSVVNFLIDGIFWYLVSCSIMFSCDKIRKARNL